MNTLFNMSEAILDSNMDSEAFVASGILDKGTKKTFTFVEFANKGFGSVNVSDNDDIGTGDIAGCSRSGSSFGQLLPPPVISTTSIANATEVRKRFVKVSQENIFAIKEKRFEEKTAKSTKWGCNKIRYSLI